MDEYWPPRCNSTISVSGLGKSRSSLVAVSFLGSSGGCAYNEFSYEYHCGCHYESESDFGCPLLAASGFGDAEGGGRRICTEGIPVGGYFCFGSVVISIAGDASSSRGCYGSSCPSVVVSGTGNATACSIRDRASSAECGATVLSLSGTGDSVRCDYYCSSYISISGTGDSVSCTYPYRSCSSYVSVSGTGDSVRCGEYAYQTSDKYCWSYVSVAPLGDANGTVPLSATGRCNGRRCIDVNVFGKANGGLLGVSGTSDSSGAFAASGLSRAEGSEVAASLLGDAKANTLAVSGNGDSSSNVVAASGTGDSYGGLLAASGAGNSSAPLAISVLGKCNGYECVDLETQEDALGSPVAISVWGDACRAYHNTCYVGVSVFGDATGLLAVSAFGNASGWLASASGMGNASGGGVAVSLGGNTSGGLLGLTLLGHTDNGVSVCETSRDQLGINFCLDGQ